MTEEDSCQSLFVSKKSVQSFSGNLNLRKLLNEIKTFKLFSYIYISFYLYLSFYLCILYTLSKAELVGAKTVKGPSPARVSTRSAACTAANRVENWGEATTSSAMFWAGAWQ